MQGDIGFVIADDSRTASQVCVLEAEHAPYTHGLLPPQIASWDGNTPRDLLAPLSVTRAEKVTYRWLNNGEGPLLFAAKAVRDTLPSVIRALLHSLHHGAGGARRCSQRWCVYAFGHAANDSSDPQSGDAWQRSSICTGLYTGELPCSDARCRASDSHRQRHSTAGSQLAAQRAVRRSIFHPRWFAYGTVGPGWIVRPCCGERQWPGFTFGCP